MDGCCGTGDVCQCKNDQHSWGWFLSAITLALIVGLLMVVFSVKANAQEPACTSREEVVTAKDKCLVIFEGNVYDVTVAKKWDLTGHVKKHACGKEYDAGTIARGPHGVSVMKPFLVGSVCTEASASAETAVATAEPIESGERISLRRVSVYLALIFFVLNFATCYAMPWAKKQAPWAGEQPGVDAKDAIGHFPFVHWHAYFAWLAIFFLGLHGVLGFACAWFGVCL